MSISDASQGVGGGVGEQRSSSQHAVMKFNVYIHKWLAVTLVNYRETWDFVRDLLQ